MLKLFITFEVGKVKKYFKEKKSAKLITSALFLAVFLFVGVGMYHFFVSAFRFINAEAVEDIRLALTLFLYEVFLVVLSGIVLFSAMVSGLFNLFKGGYNNWVISSPGYRFFPHMVLLKSIVNSSLPMLVMFVPAVLAFTKVNHLGVLSILFILVSVVALLVTLNTFTLLAITSIGSLYHAISKSSRFIPFTFKGLVIVLISAIALLIASTWKAIRSIDLVLLFRADVPTDSLTIDAISTHFRLLPTHPFAMEILSWQNSQRGEAFLYLFTLLGFTILTVFVWKCSAHLLYPLWQKFQEGTLQTNKEGGTSHKNRILFKFTGSKILTLFKKELLVFSRDYKGVLWFLFLSFIWLMQIGANFILGHNIQRYQPDVSTKVVTLQVLQFIIAIYFMSSFTLRFAFPAFSVERKTAWILGSAPLSFRKIFYGKHIFYTLFFVTLGISMNYINSRVLGLSFTHTSYSALLLVSVITFIVTLGLSLGALFPSHETDDPETISTSMPGLFFTALALIYGALSDWILYTTLLTKSGSLLLLFVLFTTILTVILLHKVPDMATTRQS